MENTIRERVKSEMINSMKEKNKNRTSILRLINNKLNEVAKNNGDSLSEDQIVSALDSMVKEREKSIIEYRKGGAESLAQGEIYEIETINGFLPERMGLDELESVCESTIEELGATSMRDMGKVIGKLKSTLGAKAKPQDIAKIVKEKLNKN